MFVAIPAPIAPRPTNPTTVDRGGGGADIILLFGEMLLVLGDDLFPVCELGAVGVCVCVCILFVCMSSREGDEGWQNESASFKATIKSKRWT
mmetsp:Transcript_24878/g.54100  ORF Transcript_24878/g.54100 Transcript_24878/m.54100 type:complete len:92 (+) Transcript_24878:476-751(+)